MTNYKVESFYRALLPKGLTGIVGTVTVRVSEVPFFPTGLLTVSPNTSKEEIVEYTSYDSVNKTITIEKRGISPHATSLTTALFDYNVPEYIFEHDTLSVISGDINNIHINQIPDLSTSQVQNSDWTFNGDVEFTNTIKVPVFFDATARDAATPTPSNGIECYLSTEGYFTDYVGGAWVQRASGATPNASETVSGKVEIATQAQVTAGTEVGETGAILTVTPTTLKSDSDSRIATVNGTISALFANDAEASAGTSTTTLMSPKNVKDYYFSQIIASDSPLATSTGGLSHSSTSYTKVREILITKPGTYRTYMEVGMSSSAYTGFAQIYKNGIAIGTERSFTTQNPSFSAYSEDFTFTSGDLIQVYTKVNSVGGVYCNVFSIRGSLVSTLPTVNL